MDIREIPPLFGIYGECSITPLESGHINSTFRVENDREAYVLQSLNGSVFSRPDAVMMNIAAIAGAFERSGEKDVLVPAFRSCEGRNYAEYGGEVWRMYRYAEPEPECREREKLAGYAFGSFIRVARGTKLIPVIRNFHNFGAYLSRLLSFEDECDAGNMHPGIFSDLKALGSELSSVFNGKLPVRTIHGDAKTDNVIIGKKLTVIDLDTAMESYAAIDFGDLIRSVSKSCKPELDRIGAAASGFSEGLGGALRDDERESLYYGILWVTGELAARYMIDFISGEGYFRGKSREQCRCRAEELLAQLDGFRKRKNDIKDIIRSSFQG